MIEDNNTLNKTLNKILIFYHKDDNDGVFSGAMLCNYLMDTQNLKKEDIHCVGMSYNLSKTLTKKTIKAYSKVYKKFFITDFSLPIPLMEYAYKLFGHENFVWFDHHKPVIEASRHSKIIDCLGVRETNRSAILCVYKYLYDPFDVMFNNSRESIPKILRILSAWDSFTHKEENFTLEYAKRVNYGFGFMFKLDIYAVAKFLKTIDDEDYMNMIIHDAYDIGDVIDEDEASKMETIIETSGDKTWTVGPDNRSAIALFISGGTNSRMFESLIGKIDNAIVFKHQSNGDWAVSLYNPDDTDKFDCGKYCRENYKGGGHVGAAGFEIKQSKFIKFLRAKHI